MKLSIHAYATHRGVSRTAVQRAIKDGRISLGEDGKIDVGEADRQWDENTQTRAGSTTSVEVNGLPTYGQSRAVREAYAALREKKEYEDRAQQLVGRDQVLQTMEILIRTAKAKLEELPSALARPLSNETTERGCLELLQASIYGVLEELSDVRNYRFDDLNLGTSSRADGSPVGG